MKLKESTKQELKSFGRFVGLVTVSAVVGTVVGHCVNKLLKG